MANFLRPLPISELTGAAASGPIAVINVSSFGSHALILTTDGVRALTLDNLTIGRVEAMSAEFQAASNNWSEAGARRMAAVFGWLWDAVCDPVLEDLGMTREAGGRILAQDLVVRGGQAVLPPVARRGPPSHLVEP